MFWKREDFKADTMKIIFENSCQIDSTVPLRITIKKQVNNSA